MPLSVEKYKVELSSQFSTQNSFSAYIVDLNKKAAETTKEEVLAWAISDIGHKYPLVTLNGGTPNVLFDMQSSLDFVQSEQFTGAELTRPLVSRLPFDYTALPMWIIGLAFRLMTKKINLNEIPNFPNFPIDTSVDDLRSISMQNSASIPLVWPNKKNSLSHSPMMLIPLGCFVILTGWIPIFQLNEISACVRHGISCPNPQVLNTVERGWKSWFRKGMKLGYMDVVMILIWLINPLMYFVKNFLPQGRYWTGFWSLLQGTVRPGFRETQ